MKHVYINEIASHVGETILLRGWIYNLRSSGKIKFLIFRDGTGFLQCVAGKADVSGEDFELISTVAQESSVEITGKVREDKRAPGGFELVLSGVRLIAGSENYPITPKEHGSSFLLDIRHLWLRSRRQHVVMKVRHHAISAIRDFLNNRGFLCLDTPIFTPNVCEGTSTLFETDYFGDKAYLSQSGQLYNEATAAAFGRVYCFGPTFRAEKSKTRRHLTEFWMVEPEVAFATLEDIIDLAEEFFEYIVLRCVESCGQELSDVLERDISKLEAVKRPFVRLHYDDAVDLLKQKGVDFEWGNDFGGGDETILGEAFDKPLLVHHYPTRVKAFYMERDPEDPEYCLSVDMLAPEGYGEMIGGGQRIHDLDQLQKRIREHDLPEEAFRWYSDLRRYGSVPHSGFGLGLERTVSYICGLKHLREAIPFPRLLNRLSP
ncbi:MAG: asparagine--tRNA ligase [Candidatus Latescibacteria bacterium]|nr:asparagine--tRNA ligase [Candidatus Latescibacterota bacterium]NIO27318.1 asparagine--tRNA ligase [Candidatus Latescibacterota bacterium]NIO54842.1 asparagine--tRNA ligase [Candidatus Latescibacterota bacterium]NIT00925.1 asparagine--tRNA ligase [Candidatus Latescibacterota bacterium]NIT37848.1 asparagine--tRNA ligase [Candidatus Latescibacterota bacterium]